MAWVKLDTQQKFESLLENSFATPQFIFKHSVRCSLSAMVYHRLNEIVGVANVFLVDVIHHRELSNQIAQNFGVLHQSPQLLVLEHGNCIFHTSHSAITGAIIEKYAGIKQ